MDQPITFTHERLDAYRVALELVTAVAPLVRGLPRGEAAIGDQLRRAADSALLNLCEAAGRRAGADKARHFDIARGSSAECGAALAVLAARGLARPDAITTARVLAHRTTAMLSALSRSARARGGA